ncbi:MAG: hypothetical protein MHMPM18_000927 [Marteilia pararefringens]
MYVLQLLILDFLRILDADSNATTVASMQNKLKQSFKIMNFDPLNSSFPSPEIFQLKNTSQSDKALLSDYFKALGEEMCMRLPTFILSNSHPEVKRHWLLLGKKKYMQKELRKSKSFT